MPDIWNQYGIKYTSSGASNDQNTFLPFQLFSNRSYYQPVDVIEFSMTSSDEDLSAENGCPINNVWAVPGSANYPGGSALFQQTLLVNKIAKYGGSYTFLIHPCSFGVNIPWAKTSQLFSDKYAFQQALIPLVKDIACFDTMEGRGDFTKARIQTGIDWVMNGSSVTVTVKIPSPISNLTLHYPTSWSLVKATTPVSVPVSGAVILVGGVPSGTYTLSFTATRSTLTPSAPTKIPSATYPVSTSAAGTLAAKPTPTHIVVIDDFSNPVRYNNQNNSLGQYTHDDNTMREHTSVQADRLFLAFSPSSYWYTLVGPPNVCNNYSSYSYLNIGLRFPFGVASAFSVNLQSASLPSCGAGPFKAVTLGPKGSNATITLSNTNTWQDLNIPLSKFNGTNLTALRAITLNAFSTNGTVELDYLTLT
ncbi:hypothetical protein BZG36_05321 [Bifiguratus adelaidae]|uniref:Uncharacterized protein n=1 Tax=Bifiguratus adelaidae TaxID=1938954 RepID=A0A261XU88_9FUNG|nr:hypothetical protein BZG36_05321 [Bifiguratus adelaidae]